MKTLYAFAIVFALVFICLITIAALVPPTLLVFADIDLGAAAVLVPNAKAILARARQTEPATNMKIADCTCLTCPAMNGDQAQGYWRLL